jgi:phosphoserine phosphatase
VAKEVAMIERLEGFPENVVAVAGTGQVTKEDYEKVLIPAVEAALKTQRKINFYYEMGPQFVGIEVGAAWQDFKEGVRHLFRFEKMALVTDVEWIRRTISGFAVFMPGELRVFPYAEQAAARAWVIGAAAKSAAE